MVMPLFRLTGRAVLTAADPERTGVANVGVIGVHTPEVWGEMRPRSWIEEKKRVSHHQRLPAKLCIRPSAPHDYNQSGIVLRTPSTSKGTNLADGSSNTVELPTDGCRAALRREHAQAVARTELTEAQENTVDDLLSISFVLDTRMAMTYGERSDVVGQLRVKTAHDEANNGLS